MANKVIMTLLVNTAVFSVLFCAMLLIRKLIGKRISPVLMLVLWLAVLVKLVIPFGFDSGFSVLPATPAVENYPYAYIRPDGGIPEVYAETDNAVEPADYGQNAPVQPEHSTYIEKNLTNVPESAAVTDWTVIALGIWAAGVLAVGAVLCMSAVNLKKRIWHARRKTPQYVFELADQCKKELGIRRHVSIMVQSAIDKPVIMGAVNPVLVLPENAKQLEREVLRHVLLHELTHFKGGDLWAIAFMNVLRALYWFNPLVWICFKLIREDIETACDQKVIKALGQEHRLSYIATVLSFAERKSSDRFAAAMGLFDGRPAMERRIKGMFGKARTGIKGRITAGIIAILILAVSALTACQPAANIMPKRKEDKWEYSRQYNLGRSLSVDAVVYSVDTETLPTLTVVPKPFESGEKIKAVTKLFCPNATMYEQGGKFTKAQLEQAIAEAQQEGLTDLVEYYKQQLPEAVDRLNEASYQLITVEDGSMQANMVAESGDSKSYIDFVNWDNNFEKPDSAKGSAFYFESDLFNYENFKTYDRLVTPESLSGDDGFVQAKEKADGYIKGMGIDYMALNSVSRGEGYYSFYYTRTYNSLSETYVKTHTGTTVTGVDGAPIVSLWEPEYLNIEIQNGNVVKARWHNPSEIKSVDNGTSEMLPWEQIKQIFLSAMDDMMTLKPHEKAVGTNAYALPEGAEVVINRVELGYTKLLTKGTNDEYRLVPTWMFLGYEKYGTHRPEESVNMGAEICYVTINAIDGTIIDRGQGL